MKSTKLTRTLVSIRVLAPAALIAVRATSLFGQTTVNSVSWAAPVNGDWSNAQSWSGGVEPKNDSPPGTAYNVDISAGTANVPAYTVTYSESLAVNQLNIAPTLSSATLSIGGGSLTVAAAGLTLAGHGNIDQTGGTVSVAPSVISSLSGTSSYNISGGTFNFAPTNNSYLTVGAMAGDAAVLRVSNLGVVNGYQLTVGLNSGGGSVVQSGGTVTLSGSQNSLSVGEGSMAFSSSGTYSLSAGQLSAANEYIGAATTGYFNQIGGTNLIPVGTTNSLAIGEDAGSSGTYNISGGTLQTSAIVLAHFGSGKLIQSGGTVSVNGVVRVGRDAGSNGGYTLSSGTLTVGGEADAGYGGTGVINQTGGTASFNGGLYIGKNAGSVGTYEIDGGTATANSISISAAGSGSLVVTGGKLTTLSTLNNNAISLSGTANASLGVVTGSSGIAASGNSTTTATSIAQSSLQLSSNARVSIVANGTNAGLSRISTLTIADNGIFDLNDNDLIAKSTTLKTTIEGYVRNARDGGNWDLPGLTTSSAKPAGSSQKPTGLGVLSGAEYMSVATANTTFDGQSVASTDTLVKYTYNGDADFNGKVDANDYGHIDSGYQNQQTAGFVFDWFHGDFDYSGKIDANDYALIDSAYQLQSGTLRSALDYLETGGLPNGTIADSLQQVIDHENEFGQAYVNDFIFANVPEPTISLAGLTFILALQSRRRRSL